MKDIPCIMYKVLPMNKVLPMYKVLLIKSQVI